VRLLLLDAAPQDCDGAKGLPGGKPGLPVVPPFYLIDYNGLSKIQQTLDAITVFIE
jgi:hypothetical protein